MMEPGQNPVIARSLEFQLRTRKSGKTTNALPLFHARRVVYALVEVVATPCTPFERYYSLAADQPRTEYVLGKALRTTVSAEGKYPGMGSVGFVAHTTTASACCAKQRYQSAPHRFERRVMALELGDGPSAVGHSGMLRCAAVTPLETLPIPDEHASEAAARPRWWAPAYGSI